MLGLLTPGLCVLLPELEVRTAPSNLESRLESGWILRVAACFTRCLEILVFFSAMAQPTHGETIAKDSLCLVVPKRGGHATPRRPPGEAPGGRRRKWAKAVVVCFHGKEWTRQGKQVSWFRVA